MKRMLKAKLAGLRDPITQHATRISDCVLTSDSVGLFSGMVAAAMQKNGFQKVARDGAGNIVGIVPAHTSGESLLLVSHMDVPAGTTGAGNEFASQFVKFKAGIISAIFAGALIKRSLLPLRGDLIVACIPRTESCDFGIRYLFEGLLKSKLKKLQGIILCEPTDGNVYLGHNGRMEYEIVIRGVLHNHFLEHKGVNMLGAMFPLIHELENASRLLPSNNALGASSLTIKDIRYGGYQPQESASEFKVIVDRIFVPEESEDYILNKAKTIAKKIYKREDHVSVNTMLAKEKCIAPTGLAIVSEKEFKPWVMDPSHPFVRMAIETLHDAGIRAKSGYWKKTFTEGSYTFASRGIPTIGFGPGSEEQTQQVSQTLPLEVLNEAVFGLGVVIARAIGVPSFGWSSDEI